MHQIHRKKFGFSLIELSVLVVIVGILAAAGISIMNSKINRTQYFDTNNKMTDIMKALRRYYARSHTLPCPAQPSALINDAGYGVSYTVSSACVGNGVAVAGGIVQTDIGGGVYIRQGALPTRDLGLPDSMMYDAYSNKFTYIVTEGFTAGATNGAITVNDGTGNNILENAAVAVISHGKDRKGAYTEGGTIGIACDSNHLDGENCDADIATLTDTKFNDEVNQNGSNNASWFDDLIRWDNMETITGLTPSSTDVLSIKFTSATYDGNLGGTAGADAKCEADSNIGAGYTFCTVSKVKEYGNRGKLPELSNYTSNAEGWIHDPVADDNPSGSTMAQRIDTCSSNISNPSSSNFWRSNSNDQDGTIIKTTNKIWEVEYNVSCEPSYKRPIACCKYNVAP